MLQESQQIPTWFKNRKVLSSMWEILGLIHTRKTIQNQLYTSVQFSCSVMSNSSWPHRLQHARLSCPSPSPGACSNSCPLSQWCHPTNLSSVIPFSSCLHSFPASGSFLTGQVFISGGQSVGASTSASVLPINIQGWFPLGLTGSIFLAGQGAPKESSPVP